MRFQVGKSYANVVHSSHKYLQHGMATSCLIETLYISIIGAVVLADKLHKQDLHDLPTLPPLPEVPFLNCTSFISCEAGGGGLYQSCHGQCRLEMKGGECISMGI